MVRNDRVNEDRQEVIFIKSLKEDLSALEHSWRNKNLNKKKVIKHFREIINLTADMARSEALEPLEQACADLKEHLASVASGKINLGDRPWTLASELMDLLYDALSEESAEPDGLEDVQAEAPSEISPEGEPAGMSDQSASLSNSTGADGEIPGQEENQMTDEIQVDPKKLLEKAQEALSSGNGEDAKELALKAADLIAKVEAEEARKRGRVLKADLENAQNEESEAVEFLEEAEGKLAEQEQELASLNDRLAEARSAFEEREGACHDVRAEIESTETELASLKEKHKLLLDRFQELLPARDAAERECAKLENEFESLPSETEELRNDVQTAHSRLTEIRNRKAELEADLQNLGRSIPV